MKLVLVGGGGHAGAVADAARSAGFDIVGVLTPEASPAVLGFVRLGDDSWIDNAPDDVGFHIALGPRANSGLREDLFHRLRERRHRLPVITASTAIVSPSASVGAGSIAMHGVVVNTGARVGQNCIVNTRAVVEHDCLIEDHTHIAPGALLAGGVHVGRQCLIGAGAVVLPGVAVADRTTIGAGTIVVRSINDEGTTWSGNPARRHK